MSMTMTMEVAGGKPMMTMMMMMMPMMLMMMMAMMMLMMMTAMVLQRIVDACELDLTSNRIPAARFQERENGMNKCSQSHADVCRGGVGIMRRLWLSCQQFPGFSELSASVFSQQLSRSCRTSRRCDTRHAHIYIYIYIYVCMYIYIYIYIFV